MMILEPIGAIFVLVSQVMRGFRPDKIKLSFIASIIGGVVLLVYSIFTSQHYIAVLNAVSVLSSIVGLYNWRNITIKKGDQ